MAIEQMMNHRARVWRPTQGRGSRAEIVRTFEVVTEPTSLNCRPAPLKWVQREMGPGEGLAATEIRRWYMTRDADVAKQDVVELYDGPDAPQNVRVLDASFPSKPGAAGHHYMLVVEPYLGPLPEAES